MCCCYYCYYYCLKDSPKVILRGGGERTTSPTFWGSRDSELSGPLSHILPPSRDLNLGLLTPQSFLFPVLSASQLLSLTGFALLFSCLLGRSLRCCKTKPFDASSLDAFQQETRPLTSVSREYSLPSLRRAPDLMTISGHLISCSSPSACSLLRAS